MASRRNSALKFYISGRQAQSLHGLADLAGGVLSAFDTAVIRATAGVKRRALPAAKRAVREHYGVKASALADKYRLETGTSRRRGEGASGFVSIWASTRQISLIDFNGRWGGIRTKGAVAQIEKGKSKVYDSAFIAVIQGRKAIRVRTRDAALQKRVPRGPVRILRGPSPFEMLSGLDHRGSRAARDRVLAELTAFYSGEFRRQFTLSRK